MSTQTTLVHTREDANSPIKKKLKESSTALSEQQIDLDRIVTAAFKSAIDKVLTPQISELKREIEKTNKKQSSHHRNMTNRASGKIGLFASIKM